jgi:histidine triad (HIT) family protein
MSTIFEKIINGEIPCHKVAETSDFLAFLDLFPVQKGHVLVVPKTSVDYFFDIEDIQFSDLMLFAKKLAIGLKKAIPCKKIGVAVIGLEVPHAHIHLIPMNSLSDMDFSNKKKFSDEELSETATLIRSFL